MRKILYLLLLFPIFAYSQDKEEAKETKTGWSFGAVPALGYNTDLGLLYGGLVNFYNFGDGSIYPKYKHSIYAEISRTTKGSGTNRIYYDTEYLIPKVRYSVDFSYLTEQALDFYGFNGYQSKYNTDWTTNDDPNYRSRLFYAYKRNVLRLLNDFHGNFEGTKLKWLAGLSLMKIDIGSIDVDNLNKGQSDNNKLPSISTMPGLYERYVKWGLIPDSEKNGGYVNFLKLGLIYDSRDNEPNPMSGIFTEADIAYAPSFLGNDDHAFSKISVIHRQYFTVVPQKLSFVYRLGFLGSLSGKSPFYFQPYGISSIMTGTIVGDGLGGSKSVRGVIRNRILGDNYFYGNLETRWKFMFFKIKKNNVYLALNAFYDFGQVLNAPQLDLTKIPAGEDPKQYFDQSADGLHTSVGGGFRFVLNQNFVVAIDYGIPLDKRDGKSGLYVGLNYLF